MIVKQNDQSELNDKLIALHKLGEEHLMYFVMTESVSYMVGSSGSINRSVTIQCYDFPCQLARKLFSFKIKPERIRGCLAVLIASAAVLSSAQWVKGRGSTVRGGATRG